MPKVSYVQMIEELESAVTLVRLNADVLPELALTVADELEATVATIKEMKQEQRSVLAAQMEKTAQLTAVVAQGTKNARQIRAYAALVFCHKKQAVLTHFGIRDRRRPRRTTRRSRAIDFEEGASGIGIGGNVLREGERPRRSGETSLPRGEAPPAFGEPSPGSGKRPRASGARVSGSGKRRCRSGGRS